MLKPKAHSAKMDITKHILGHQQLTCDVYFPNSLGGTQNHEQVTHSVKMGVLI